MTRPSVFYTRTLTVRPLRVALAVAAAVPALLAAGCGGGSKPPGVANIGTASTPTTTASSGNGGGTSSAQPKGNAVQLLAEWAACMRSHGDPQQTDPTIEPNKVIQITLPAGYDQGPGLGGKGGGNNPCASYMNAASTALRGGAPAQRPDPAKLLQFSQCMRANGIPDFPDPSGNGLSIQRGGDLDPNNPAFRNAQKLCGKKVGLQGPIAGGAPQPGTIRVTVAGAPPPPGGG
jgi:hypothetical protein